MEKGRKIKKKLKQKESWAFSFRETNSYGFIMRQVWFDMVPAWNAEK